MPISPACHHECWNGSGYPKGLKGEDIPLEARIISVADVNDAFTSTRPYKKAWTSDEALAFLRAQAEKNFDPACVQALSACLLVIRDIHHHYANDQFA